MTKECKNHVLKAIYYRKKEERKSQNWVRVKGLRICEKCLKIIRVKEELEEIVKK